MSGNDKNILSLIPGAAEKTTTKNIQVKRLKKVNESKTYLAASIQELMN